MRVRRRVWRNKGNNQKLITIPKDCDIEEGDYVWVSTDETPPPLCLYCKKPILNKRNKKFCNLSCSTSYNNKYNKDYSYFKGDNNPSKRPEVKEKISKSLKGRTNTWQLGEKNHNFGGLTEETKHKLSESHKGLYDGDKHPNWKGGISFIEYPKEFRIMRSKILKEVLNCEVCGKHKETLNHKWFKNFDIHHIDGDKFNNDRKNLMVVCRQCHFKIGGKKNDVNNR